MNKQRKRVVRVDYHVHPNLGKRPSKRRIQAFWKAFANVGLDAVVCTEHAFKDPVCAYRFLMAGRPQHASTQVYPGAELLSSEGVDVIAFGQEDWYDDHVELLRPFGMTIHRMLAYLKESGLTYFIPHPFCPTTGIIRLCREPGDLAGMLLDWQGIEIANASVYQLSLLLTKAPIRFLVRRFRNRMALILKLPAFYEAVAHAFYAVGSDAHHPAEVGPYIAFPAPEDCSRESLFLAMVTNTDISDVELSASVFHPFHLLRTGCTALREFVIKRELLFRRRFAPRAALGGRALEVQCDSGR